MIPGDFAPKEAVQLNAPTDISMFEKLKVSLKDFLNRQILSQVSDCQIRPHFFITNSLWKLFFPAPTKQRLDT